MHPVLFTIPFVNIPIHSYGTMLGISLVTGWFLTLRFGASDISASQLKKLMIAAILCALAGARLLAIFTQWSQIDWSHPLSIFVPGNSGLVAYGGFLGGFLGALFYTKKRRLPLLSFADAATPAMALGLFATRIGCFLYGCDYGKPIALHAPRWVHAMGQQFPNWAVRFAHNAGFHHHPALQKGSPAFWHHVEAGLISSDASVSLPVYPTQLLSSLNGLFALGLLLLLRNQCHYKGQLFLFFVMYYGCTRTLIEFLRGDSGRGVLLSLTTSQWIGILSFAIALAVHVKKRSVPSPP